MSSKTIQVTQNSCITTAIVTGVVFLSGIAGYMYMENCQKNKNCENKFINNTNNSNLQQTTQSVIDKEQEEVSNESTGSVNLDAAIRKMEKFSNFSPKTLPVIKKALKNLNEILKKVKNSKKDDDIDYFKQKQKAEAENQSLKTQMSNLGLEIPDNEYTRKAFDTNSKIIINTANKYLTDIKTECAKHTSI